MLKKTLTWEEKQEYAERLWSARQKKNEYYKTISKVKLPDIYYFKHITIFIGGCIERGIGSSFHATAHAHNREGDEHFNTICIRSVKKLGKYHEEKDKDGKLIIVVDKPSQTLLHEIAHLLVPNQGHTKKWLNIYISLGASKAKIIKCKNRWKTCN